MDGFGMLNAIVYEKLKTKRRQRMLPQNEQQAQQNEKKTTNTQHVEEKGKQMRDKMKKKRFDCV